MLFRHYAAKCCDQMTPLVYWADCYSAPDKGAEYCDERVCLTCLSVCLCVCICLSAIISSELHVRSSRNFLCVLPMAVAQSFSGTQSQWRLMRTSVMWSQRLRLKMSLLWHFGLTGDAVWCAHVIYLVIMRVQNSAVVVVVTVLRQFKFILDAHLLFSNVEPSMQIANPFAVCQCVFSFKFLFLLIEFYRQQTG